MSRGGTSKHGSPAHQIFIGHTGQNFQSYVYRVRNGLCHMEEYPKMYPLHMKF